MRIKGEAMAAPKQPGPLSPRLQGLVEKLKASKGSSSSVSHALPASVALQHLGRQLC